MNFTEEAKFL